MLLSSRVWRYLRRWCITIACLGLFAFDIPRSHAQDASAIRLKIVGGLANNTQYTRLEAPFWIEAVPRLTQGRVRADISPFDRSGFRGPEILSMMRSGLVPFGNVLLAVAASVEPELNAIDLPMLNPDLASLRRTTALWRPRLETMLRDQFGIQLLAVYTYPAQVVFCRRSFANLGDLAGRTVRISSVGQGEVMTALGAVPIVLPYAEILDSIRNGVVDCAVTGGLPGNNLGLPTVTTHVSREAINWGVSFFGANIDAWMRLPQDLRMQLQAALADLEKDIWDAANRDTEEAVICNSGRSSCTGGIRGQMVVVDGGAQEAPRRAGLLRNTVLPGWIKRCGMDCVDAWNSVMAPSQGVLASPP